MLVRRLCATPALLTAKNYVATLNVHTSLTSDGYDTSVGRRTKVKASDPPGCYRVW